MSLEDVRCQVCISGVSCYYHKSVYKISCHFIISYISLWFQLLFHDVSCQLTLAVITLNQLSVYIKYIPVVTLHQSLHISCQFTSVFSLYQLSALREQVRCGDIHRSRAKSMISASLWSQDIITVVRLWRQWSLYVSWSDHWEWYFVFDGEAVGRWIMQWKFPTNYPPERQSNT